MPGLPFIIDDQELTALLLHAKKGAEERERLRRVYGEGAVRISEVNLYLTQNTNVVSQLPNPPRCFISYRWESDEARAWVRRLAEGVRARGMEATLDQWESMRPGEVNVPKLVAELGRCHHAVFVVTPEWLRSVSLSQYDRHWVFDECYAALLLAREGWLRLHWVWRDGDAGLMPEPPEGLIDFRDDRLFGRLLDKHFSFIGPRLPADSPAHTLWQEGWKLLAANLYFDAEALFRHAVEAYPEIDSFWSHLAFTRLGLGKRPEAYAALARAHRLDPRQPFTLGLMAEEAYGQRDLRRAEKLVRALVAESPRDPRASFVMGNILDDQGNHREAIRHFEAFIGRRPRNPHGFNNCGTAHMNLGEYDEAIQMFDRAIELEPGHLLARLNKAKALS